MNDKRKDNEREKIASQKLEACRDKPVLFTVKSSISYKGHIDDDAPISGRAVTFDIDDFIHIREKYDDDWWIGRVISPDPGVGFIPSPVKIEKIRSCSRKTRKSKVESVGTRDKKGEKSRTPYEVVPNVRPVVLVGPSLKGYEVTDMMQKAVFDFIRRHFDGRVNITRISADLTLAKQADRAFKEQKTGVKQHLMEVQSEVERIFELARGLQLVVIDADTINHPNQIIKTHLAPIIVQIKINSLKVLQRLIKSRGKMQSRNMNVQIVAAEKLSQCCPEHFDVTLDENSLDEACDHLAEYLEAYWQTIHPEAATLQQANDSSKGQEGKLSSIKRNLSYRLNNKNKPVVKLTRPSENDQVSLT